MGAGTIKIKCNNILVYDWKNLTDAGGIVNYKSACSLFVYNSTIVNCIRGVHKGSGGGVTVLRNCLFYDNITDVSATMLDSSCATTLTSSGGLTASGRLNRFSQNFTFIDSANDNFGLAETDGGARNYGQDLSADPAIAFNTDVNGLTRNVPWNIGFWENDVNTCDTARTTAYLARCTTGVAYSKSRSFTHTIDSAKHRSLQTGLSENILTGTVSGTPTVTDTTFDTLLVYSCNDSIFYVDTFYTIDTTGTGCVAPEITYGTPYCTVGVAFGFAPETVTNTDSVTVFPSLPSGYTLTKTGINKGLVAGTATIIHPSVSYRFKAWGCAGNIDSFDVALGVIYNPYYVPATEDATPSAGHRVWQQLPQYDSYDSIRHAIYLPVDYDGVTTIPAIIELPGNTNNAVDGPTEAYWPVMGYGVSRGAGFIWVSIPFLVTNATGICYNYWEACGGSGYPTATVTYVKRLLTFLAANYAVDTNRICMMGFSRGGVATSLIALADDTIAQKWNGLHVSGYGDVGSYGGSPTPRINRMRLPIMLSAGENDGFLSLVNAHATLLDEAGKPYTKIIVPGYGHNIQWIKTKNNSSAQLARNWLLALESKATFTAIDSIRPSPQYVNQAPYTTKYIDIYGRGFLLPGRFIIGSTPVTNPLLWSATHITDTIPPSIDRGKFKVKVITSLGDTIMAADSLRLCKLRIK
jgi:pimeloyl-ACP methyl ester carboxylesterase